MVQKINNDDIEQLSLLFSGNTLYNFNENDCNATILLWLNSNNIKYTLDNNLSYYCDNEDLYHVYINDMEYIFFQNIIILNNKHIYHNFSLYHPYNMTSIQGYDNVKLYLSKNLL